MINHKHILFLELERYPEYCEECPMFCKEPYQCHNERGMKAGCSFGYMDNYDMRDFYGDILFDKCRIKDNPNVSIIKETNKTCSNCSYSQISCGDLICKYHNSCVNPTGKCSWYTKK